MTIEQIMLLASTCQTPRDWSEFRKHISALVAQARDEEAEACALIVEDYVRMVDAQSALAAIRARIAARKEQSND